MEKGFIGIWRKIRDWEWYTDTNTKSLFIHLILSVNHSDKNWQGQLIKRGQLISSYEKLSVATGLSIQEVRTALDKLILTKNVDKVSTNKHTMITLTNYNTYQDFSNVNNKQTTNKQQSNNKQLTTTKELKELKESKKIKERGLSHFEIINSLNKKEVIEIKKKYNLPSKEWDFCIAKFNKKVFNNGHDITDFENFVSNWKNNLDKNSNNITSNVNPADNIYKNFPSV